VLAVVLECRHPAAEVARVGFKRVPLPARKRGFAPVAGWQRGQGDAPGLWRVRIPLGALTRFGDFA
jgi:hypothetical protein